LSRVNGVLVGAFVGADEDYDGHDFLLDEVLAYYARLSGKPWVKCVPVGHVEENLYLPFGVRARVTAAKDGKAGLAIVENPLEAQGHRGFGGIKFQALGMGALIGGCRWYRLFPEGQNGFGCFA
ncbi:MAG: hypothetical protein IKR28_09525, partial [Selenomonadaceae bacterium]|nr:hypothetical protein [Selenomonadaceae bacterium]